MGSGHDNNVVAEAQKYVGVKEATGNNDGEPYRLFMKPYGYGRVPWCALFVKRSLDDAEVNTQGINATAISAVSQNIVRTFDVGNVWWKPRSGGTGHVGIIADWPPYSDHFTSIEGNYSDQVKVVKRPKNIAQRAAKYIDNPKALKVIVEDQKRKVSPTVIDETIRQVKQQIAYRTMLVSFVFSLIVIKFTEDAGFI